MVTEATETFARQLAARPELLQPAGQQYVPKQSAPPAPSVVRQPGLVRSPPVSTHGQSNTVGQGQQHNSVQRAEDVLLAVAGCSTKGLVNDLENLSEEEFVAATKKKGPSCFRCRKVGHFLNDCEAMLCDCCQKSEHATEDCHFLGLPDLVSLCMVWRTRTWPFGNYLYHLQLGQELRILGLVEWRCLAVHSLVSN
jgi:hypothetical protein